jgi:hypothetical protein
VFGFKQKKAQSASEAHIAALQAQYFPRISIQQHAYAKAKVARERQKVMLLQFPDGTRLPVCNGQYSWDDLRAAEGYGCWVKGYDRFGWPEGHPESPASQPNP